MNYKRIMMVAMAYVGVTTGAGLASGQEVFQYFVSFGKIGLVGVVLAGVLHAVFGRIILMFGSYYRADEHSVVLEQITGKFVYKLLDYSLIFSSFVMGLIMIAGAGANLNQQFSLPVWVGSLLCAGLVVAVSMMNFERVTQALAIFTPVIVGLVLLLTLYTFWTKPFDWQFIEAFAKTQTPALPNIWLSVVNYYAMCIMGLIAMSFVLGGNEMYVGEAGRGGFLGGAITGVLTTCMALVLFANIQLASSTAIPMQALFSQIHPALGTLMSVIIFGMIFNTAISLYYSLARRFSGSNESRFKVVMIGFVAVGFVLSFAGFKTLVATVFPILGYIGMLIVVVLAVAWVKNRHVIENERLRRRKIFDLMMQKHDTEQDFDSSHQKHLDTLIDNSVLDNEELRQEMRDMAQEQLGNKSSQTLS